MTGCFNIGGYVCRTQSVANDALKKNVGKKQRMTAAGEADMTISLTKSPSYCGVSRTAWYYARRSRDPTIDRRMESRIMEITKTRPTYGTRRMATSSLGSWGLP